RHTRSDRDWSSDVCSSDLSREESHEKEDRPPARQPAGPSLDEQRADLDGRLRAELERQGIVVDGKDIARVVGVAVGKGIEWAGRSEERRVGKECRSRVSAG